MIQANFFFEYLIAFLTGLAVLLENLQWQLKLNSGISIVNQPVPSVYKDPIEEKKRHSRGATERETRLDILINKYFPLSLSLSFTLRGFEVA